MTPTNPTPPLAATGENALHAAIMNIQVTEKVKRELEGAPKGFYLLGHHDARHAAAELALAASPLVQPAVPVTLGNQARALALRGLLGIIGSAQAQARRILASEGDADDLRQDRRDLPTTLDVIRHAVESLAAGATPVQATEVAPPKTLDDPRLQELFTSCIDGALTSGYQGVSPPPEGHWLAFWWKKGQAVAMVEEGAKRATEGPVVGAASEPDMRAVCDALGFDPTNHHNAAKCPYCRPTPLARSPLTDDQIAWHYADSDLQPQLYDKPGMFEAGVRYAERSHGIVSPQSPVASRTGSAVDAFWGGTLSDRNKPT